jgi:predicted phage tail protein
LQHLSLIASLPVLSSAVGLLFPRDEHTSDRVRQVMEDNDANSAYWKWIFGVGWLLLVAFGVLWVVGWPGAGVILVPLGMGMILGGGIQLLLNRI